MKQIDSNNVPDTIIPGEPFVEAAFTTGDHFLIFSSSKDAHEPTLCIQLFNPNGEEQEKIELFEAYASGEYKINSVDNSQIIFSFWSSDLLKLIYSEKPKWVFRSPLGVHYAQKFTRRRLSIA